MTRRTALAALLLTAALGCGGPCGPLPGGRLAGPEAPCPSGSFDAARGVREVQLEVRPDDPWSVTTWALVLDGVLYVPADFLNPVKRWPGMVVADPRVRVRVAGTVYACRAERVDDAIVVNRLRDAAAKKYELDPDGLAARTEVWWFRIGPRRAVGGSGGAAPGSEAPG